MSWCCCSCEDEDDSLVPRRVREVLSVRTRMLSPENGRPVASERFGERDTRMRYLMGAPESGRAPVGKSPQTWGKGRKDELTTLMLGAERGRFVFAADLQRWVETGRPVPACAQCGMSLDGADRFYSCQTCDHAYAECVGCSARMDRGELPPHPPGHSLLVFRRRRPDAPPPTDETHAAPSQGSTEAGAEEGAQTQGPPPGASSAPTV